MTADLQAIESQVERDILVLYRAESLFPFDIFPTQVLIYPTRVEIVDVIFFGSQEVKSIMIQDIFTIDVITSLWLSSIRITSRQPTRPVIVVTKLKNKDALRIKNIVQGLVIAQRNGLDLLHLNPAQIVQEAFELGQTPVHLTT